MSTYWIVVLVELRGASGVADGLPGALTAVTHPSTVTIAP